MSMFSLCFMNNIFKIDCHLPFTLIFFNVEWFQNVETITEAEVDRNLICRVSNRKTYTSKRTKKYCDLTIFLHSETLKFQRLTRTKVM